MEVLKKPFCKLLRCLGELERSERSGFPAQKGPGLFSRCQGEKEGNENGGFRRCFFSLADLCLRIEMAVHYTRERLYSVV